MSLTSSLLPLLSRDRKRVLLPDNWEIPVVFLDDLDLAGARFIHGPRHQASKNDIRQHRFVYQLSGSEHYAKVWPPEYTRGRNFVAALRIGFYDREVCPALTCLIATPEFECRGYIMMPGELMKREVPASLLKHLLLKSTETGHVYYDLVRCTIRMDEGYSLIDLEGVYEFSQLAHYWRARLIGKRTRGLVASPIDYHRQLSRLRRKLERGATRADLADEVARAVRRLPFVLHDQ